MFIIMSATNGSRQVIHHLVHRIRLPSLGNRYLQFPTLGQFLLLVVSILVPFYYPHCFQGVMSHSQQYLCCQDLCLSPDITANGSVQNQPSTGQYLCICFTHSCRSCKVWMNSFRIYSKIRYPDTDFFSIGVYYRDLFSETLLVEALQLWSSLWRNYCVILAVSLFHPWLSQQSVVMKRWLPKFLSSEF